MTHADFLLHKGRGLGRFLITEFGMGMEVPADFNGFREGVLLCELAVIFSFSIFKILARALLL